MRLFLLHCCLAGAQARKSVQFNEEVQVEQFDPDSVRIDEAVIDQALDQIQNADPTGLTEDSLEMINLEGKPLFVRLKLCDLLLIDMGSLVCEVARADAVRSVKYVNLPLFCLLSRQLLWSLGGLGCRKVLSDI